MDHDEWNEEWPMDQQTFAPHSHWQVAGGDEECLFAGSCVPAPSFSQHHCGQGCVGDAFAPEPTMPEFGQPGLTEHTFGQGSVGAAAWVPHSTIPCEGNPCPSPISPHVHFVQQALPQSNFPGIVDQGFVGAPFVQQPTMPEFVLAPSLTEYGVQQGCVGNAAFVPQPTMPEFGPAHVSTEHMFGQGCMGDAACVPQHIMQFECSPSYPNPRSPNHGCVGDVLAPEFTMPEFGPAPVVTEHMFGQGCMGDAACVPQQFECSPSYPNPRSPNHGCVGDGLAPEFTMPEFGPAPVVTEHMFGQGFVGGPCPSPGVPNAQSCQATLPVMCGQGCVDDAAFTMMPGWEPEPTFQHVFGQGCVGDALPPGITMPEFAPARVEQGYDVHRYLQDTALMPMEPPSSASVPPGPLPEVVQESQAQTLATQLAVAKQEKPDPKEVHRTIIRPSTEQEMPCRPALVRVTGDHVLAALVQGDQPGGNLTVEWDWGRAVSAVGLKTQKVGQYLSRNKELHTSELLAAEIAETEIMYKGVGSKASTGSHCMNSSAFMLLLCLLCTSRQIAVEAKKNALSIAISLLQIGVQALSSEQEFSGICFVQGQGYFQEPLSVDSQGIVKGLHSLLKKTPRGTLGMGSSNE